MNNSIETICQSLCEKGQIIKDDVARSIEKLHLQEQAPKAEAKIAKKSNTGAKFLIFGGLFCLATGIILSVSQQNTIRNAEDSKLEQKKDKSPNDGESGTQCTASLIMDIIGAVGLCSGTVLAIKKGNNKTDNLHRIKVDYSKCSSDLIDAICSIKESCSKEWDAVVMEHTRLCKQAIESMNCTENEKIERIESITTFTLIRYNSFEIQQLIESAVSSNSIIDINKAVDVCSNKLQEAVNTAINQQVSIFKNVIS